MNIGYGATVWSVGTAKGHLDGIGVYTKELFNAYSNFENTENLQLLPLAFGQSFPQQSFGVPQCLQKHFIWHVLGAALLGQKLSCAKQGIQIDLFHATDHHIPALKDVPVVATVMDLIPFLHPEWVSPQFRKLKNWLFKKTIMSADHLITISDYSKQDLIRHFGIPAERISVTSLGVDTCYFQRVSEVEKQRVLNRLNLKPGFFLFVGTLQPRKNLTALLDAHAQLPAAYRREHPIIVVGHNGWGVDHLLPRLQSLEAQEELRWLDYLIQSDVIALLQTALALVFVSLYEGFGLPVVEAFAAGCPVIASNTTSIPEVAGDAALLVNPVDPVALTQAMKLMIENVNLAENYKHKGFERARQYSWAACAKATHAIYQNVLCIKTGA
jgi:glycosyltransferase involved in cell wall biosynthesis